MLHKATTNALVALTRLRADESIHLTLGSGAKAKKIQVPRSIVVTVSKGFTRWVARNLERVPNGDNLLATIVQDAEAFKVLLHWKIIGRLPPLEAARKDESEAQAQLLCQCWILGEKWEVSTFQDLVMLELLRTLRTTTPSLATLQLVFDKSKTESKLRNLMAEEIPYGLRSGHGDDTWPMAELEKLNGLRESFHTVLEGMRKTDDDIEARLSKPELWKALMVGEGPHWVCYKEGAEDDEEED